MKRFIDFAVAMGGERAGQNLAGDDIARLVQAPDLVWVHMRAYSAETRAWIRANLSYLDRHALDALLADETRPRVSEIGNGVLIILRGVNTNKGAEPDDMVSIRLWVDENRIISLSKRPLGSVGELRRQIQEGGGPVSAGGFVAALIELLNVRIEGFRHDLDEETDRLEQLVIEAPDQEQRRPIMEKRLQTIIFRRYITPQRDEVAHLTRGKLSFLTEEDRRHLLESHQNLIRVVEDLDAIRERLQILKDELASIMGDRLNRNMYLLSIIAALFLPLGFLTGMFGINLAGMPGANDPAAFWIFAAVLIFITAFQFLMFRLLKWF
ncbi:MAG: zinc transporter ZntB [Rhodobacteraceae bacterium]|nr:zinc transporter ZntB [Paracoccaceae bacterium]